MTDGIGVAGIESPVLFSDTGIRPDCLAEIIVVAPDGSRTRGSGYRVTQRTILTAWHVVAGAQSIEARFDAGQPTAWTVVPWVLFKDPRSDIAVLAFAGPSHDRLAGQPLGSIRAAAAVVNVQVAGFPRWKLRNLATTQHKYRVVAHEAGTAAALANSREQTLQINVPPPAADPQPNASPWEGMSGGPVFADARLIGVISKQHPREGLNRLTAIRLDRCLEQLADGPRRDLREALGLIPDEDLIDVVPKSPAAVVVSAYREQIKDMAPIGALRDREAELDAITAFCAGDENYMWWQAEPWAGKSALLATFALKPPLGVRVVSFFITGRLAGQTDSTAFTEAMIEQLSAIVGQPMPFSGEPTSRDAYRRWLLTEAARHLATQRQRLVVVVDGIDEDTAAGSDSSLPSIASLLPKRPEHRMKVILAGRPHPPIPSDVASDHPLRVAPIHHLRPSPFAVEIQRDAEYELARQLAAGEPRRKILGLIAASGGGLTVDDLEQLTGQPRDSVEALVTGVFGRTVQGRIDTATDNPQHVYLFAHETLRVEACRKLGRRQLQSYTQQLHGWADQYRSSGWPKETPGYLLRGYYRMLQVNNDLIRMAALATDGARHDRLLQFTGGNAVALSEIGIAQDYLMRRSDGDALTMGRLAVYHDLLTHRSGDVDPALSCLWAELGFLNRAETLANIVLDPIRRAETLVVIARAAAERHNIERAESIAHSIEPLDARWQAIMETCVTTISTSDFERADRLLSAARELPQFIRPLAAHQGMPGTDFLLYMESGIRKAAQHTRLDHNVNTRLNTLVEELHRRLGTTSIDVLGFAKETHSEPSLAGRVQALVRSGDRKEVIATIEAAMLAVGHEQGKQEKARLLAEVARACAHSGQPSRCTDLARIAETMLASEDRPRDEKPVPRDPEPYDPPSSQSKWARLLNLKPSSAHPTSEPSGHRAPRASRSETDLPPPPPGLPPPKPAAGDSGRPTRTRRHAFDDAAATQRGVAIAVFGRREPLEGAYEPATPDTVARIAVIHALAENGDIHGAQALANRIGNSRAHQANVLIAEAMLRQANELSPTARDLANSWEHVEDYIAALRKIASDVVATRDFARLTRLAAETRRYRDRDRALLAEIEALALDWDIDTAESLVYAIHDPPVRVDALLNLVRVMAARGLTVRAQRTGTELSDAVINLGEAAVDVLTYLSSLTEASRALASVSSHDNVRMLAAAAEMTTKTVHEPSARTSALALLGRVLAAAGQPDPARSMAEASEIAARSIPDPAWCYQAVWAATWAAAEMGDLERIRLLTGWLALMASLLPDRDRRDHKPTLDVLNALVRVQDLDRIGVLGAVVAQVSVTASADDHSEQLARLAEAAAAQGDAARARLIAELAAAIARLVPDLDRRAWALREIAGAAAKAGDYISASTVARAIDNPDQIAATLLDLTRIAVRAGAIDPAKKIASSIEIPDRRADALLEVIGAKAKVGDVAGALEVATAIGIDAGHAQALTEVAWSVASLDLNAAVSIASLIRDPHWRNWLLSVIASSPHFDFRAAAPAVSNQPSAGKQSEGRHRSSASSSLAEEPTIEVPAYKDLMLLAIERAARAGDAGRAVDLALQLDTADGITHALTILAPIASDARLRLVITRAFRIGNSTKPLGTLAKLDPDLAKAIIDEILVAVELPGRR